MVKFPPEPEYSTSAVDPLKLRSPAGHRGLLQRSDAGHERPEPARAVGRRLPGVRREPVRHVREPRRSHHLRDRVRRPRDRRRHQDRPVAAHEVRLRGRDRRRAAGGRRRDDAPTWSASRSTSTPGRSRSAAFLLFRGRVELLGGPRQRADHRSRRKGAWSARAHRTRTDIAAQVTFGLDISIFLVINISFSQSWQESRQIA